MVRNLIMSLAVAAGIMAVAFYLVLVLAQDDHSPLWTMPEGDAREGKRALVSFGCHGCHVIGGIREATGRVGPKLEEIDEQIYIGGVLPNSPDNMVRWLMEPERFTPRTAMPNLDLPETHARNIMLYLFEGR